VPTAPAIANAIHSALGVEIDSLPITSQKVWEALQAQVQRNERPE
jgi:CO/xanthine dehydrogenase Mo-binding subunit